MSTENENFDKQRILERVRKMLALANDAAASEGERDNAIRMAHATLAKYNLHLSEVAALKTKKGERPSLDPRVEKSATDYGYPWARQAAQAIARLYFCEYFFLRTRQTDKVIHVFIGSEANSIVANEMARYVIKSILSEAGRRMRNASETWAWHTSFCKGASYALYYRCEDLRNASTRTASAPGTALMLVDVYTAEQSANRAYLALHHNLVQAKDRQRAPTARGYESGREYGNNINLSAQLK